LSFAITSSVQSPKSDRAPSSPPSMSFAIGFNSVSPFT